MDAVDVDAATTLAETRGTCNSLPKSLQFHSSFVTARGARCSPLILATALPFAFMFPTLPTTRVTTFRRTIGSNTETSTNHTILFAVLPVMVVLLAFASNVYGFSAMLFAQGTACVVVLVARSLFVTPTTRPAAAGVASPQPLLCQLWCPESPLPPLPSDRTVVLLIRHGPKHLGAGKDELTTVGAEEARKLALMLRQSGFVIRACFTSKLHRCYETAKAISDANGSVLATAQILGGDGPFVRDDVVSQVTCSHSLEDYPIVDHTNLVMQSIVEGRHVDGYHRRTLGVSRIGADLDVMLGGSGPSSDFHVRTDGLVVAVSHDMIIAAVMLELGLPCAGWPDYLSGLIVDLELLKSPRLRQHPSVTFSPIAASKELPKLLSVARGLASRASAIRPGPVGRAARSREQNRRSRKPRQNARRKPGSCSLRSRQ